MLQPKLLFRILPTAYILAIIAYGTSRLTGEEPSLTFEKDIRPILKSHCFHCHGESGVTESQLDLRLRRLILKGGDSGPALQPGSIDQSLLWKKIASNDMPPEDKSLPLEQKRLIKQWIQQGASVARPEPEHVSDNYMTEEELSFWSFQPIQNPPVPVSSASPSQTPVDAFISRSMKPSGLKFSPRASRQVLVRRLYFDLLGLPPSPWEIQAFLNDRSPHAYEQLVDRLLMSPRYGERWGRHWLDVAGYADSEGFTDQDPVREFAFFYRDYVIESFNAGQPFDEFIIEQLAGDELMESPLDQMTAKDKSRLIATGFLRMAPDGSASGGVNRNVAINETIADTLTIVSSSLMGLTVGCARCHNHRYDPIRQVDYYRLRAIFTPALDWKNWKTPKQRQISLYTSQETQMRSQIEAQAKTLDAERLNKQKAHIERTLYEELLVAPDNQRSALRTAYQTENSKRTPEQIDLLEAYPNIQNISNQSLYLYAEQRARRANEIQAAGKEKQETLIITLRENALGKLPPEQAAKIKAVLAIPLKQRSQAQRQLESQHPEAFVTPETLQQFDPVGAKRVAEYHSAAERCRKTDAKTELANLAAASAKLRKTAPTEYFVRGLVEPENHSPETRLFKRGNHDQPGEKVDPGELQIITRISPVTIQPQSKQIKTTGRRLAYAKHLTSGKHPLVARVMVNRLWLHHFGKGIVETTGDFGALGTPPTHPELLDWLAHQLMDSGWNLKLLHREILLSRTYQQQSRGSEIQESVDPENSLYSKQNARRLESEAIRDSILQVTGMAVNKMLGPAVPVKEDAVGQIV
ncbi:MAG: DUF1549 domain-containing protein, partial [Planctomycetota bacterium]|nr:DUF1549 domain-containing protein [Planctomycetota bacterium]